MLQKALPEKRLLLAFIVGSIIVVVLAVLIALIQAEVIDVRSGMFLKSERSPSEPPAFAFNVYGGAKNSIEELAKPMGIGLAGKRIFVADSAHGLVKVFDGEGKLLKTISLRQEPLSNNRPVATYPVGIAVSEEGRVYVSDMETSRIMVFDGGGRALGMFPGERGDRSVLRRPLALAAAGGFLYVTDIGDHSVKVFNEKGKLLKKFGKSGVGEGEFSFPNGVAVSEDGSIYVADSNNSRVQVFSPEGKFKFLFQGDPPFSLPRGLAIDSLRRLHVADTLAHKVSVFTLGGKFLFSYGWDENEEEGSEQELYYPHGIAIDGASRKIYVTDKGNNRVSVWKY